MDQMDRATKAFVLFVILLGIIIFGLPLTGLGFISRSIGGIQIGVLVAWAATIVIPVLILAFNFSYSGRAA